MSTYTEDHLVEQPAIQLMQHELGWDVVNCYEEWSGGVSNQGRDGKREVEVEILNVGFLILNGRGRRPTVPRLNPNSGGGGGVRALVDGFQYFWRFHRLVKLAILLKRHSIFTESGVSRMRERGDFVQIRPRSACALPRIGVAGNFTVENQTFPHSPPAAIEVDFEDFSPKRPFLPKRENAKFRENLTNFHEMRLFHQSVK
jgi:hypothetical protein